MLPLLNYLLNSQTDLLSLSSLVSPFFSTKLKKYHGFVNTMILPPVWDRINNSQLFLLFSYLLLSIFTNELQYLIFPCVSSSSPCLQKSFLCFFFSPEREFNVLVNLGRINRFTTVYSFLSSLIFSERSCIFLNFIFRNFSVIGIFYSI